MHLPQRFKHAVVEREAGRWIRAHSRQVIDCSEALKFVIGDKIDKSFPRDHKVGVYYYREVRLILGNAVCFIVGTDCTSDRSIIF